MKKFKLVIWLLIAIVIGVVIYQNKAFFMTKQAFHLNTIAAVYESPAIPVAVVFVGCFIVGLIVAYLFSIPTRLKAHKTIRNLNDTISAQGSDLTALKSELDALKQQAPSPAGPTETPADTEQDPPAAAS